MPRVEMMRVYRVHWCFSEFSPADPHYRPDEHRIYDTWEEAAGDAAKCLELEPDSLVTIETELMPLAEWEDLQTIPAPSPQPLAREESIS